MYTHTIYTHTYVYTHYIYTHLCIHTLYIHTPMYTHTIYTHSLLPHISDSRPPLPLPPTHPSLHAMCTLQGVEIFPARPRRESACAQHARRQRSVRAWGGRGRLDDKRKRERGAGGVSLRVAAALFAAPGTLAPHCWRHAQVCPQATSRY